MRLWWLWMAGCSTTEPTIDAPKPATATPDVRVVGCSGSAEGPTLAGDGTLGRVTCALQPGATLMLRYEADGAVTLTSGDAHPPAPNGELTVSAWPLLAGLPLAVAAPDARMDASHRAQAATQATADYAAPAPLDVFLRWTAGEQSEAEKLMIQPPTLDAAPAIAASVAKGVRAGRPVPCEGREEGWWFFDATGARSMHGGASVLGDVRYLAVSTEAACTGAAEVVVVYDVCAATEVRRTELAPSPCRDATTPAALTRVAAASVTTLSAQ
jgi:hypothetical protein